MAVLESGTRLGNYKIERLVGVGSMGAVYEGVAVGSGKRFAIKVLAPALAALPTARDRFLREAKLASRVRHANVVEVIEVREDAGYCFLVMELLAGEDLARRLRRSGTLSPVETAEIMLPVCDAVSAAHRQGITHRDLKPSNIFLATRGPDGGVHPVVLDFGIALEEGAAGADGAGSGGATTTARQPVFGTPYYLAPEQVVDHRAAGPTTDQYALGVILYECLTGQPPFRGETVEEVFQAIAAGKPPAPSALRPDIPHALDAVVLRALSRDPKERFVWVAALRRALASFASKPPENPLVPDVARPTRPTPSSPAIALEASVPSPFVRTLTPEVEAMDAAWFAAGEAHETAGEARVNPSQDPSGPVVGEALSTDADADWEVEAAPSSPAWWKQVPGTRIWMGAGVALATVALVIVLTRGGSSATRTPSVIPAASAPAAVRVEPAANPPTETAPPTPAAAPPQPAAPAPTAASAPAAAPSEPAAPPPAAAPPAVPPPAAEPIAAAPSEPAAPPPSPRPIEPAPPAAAPAEPVAAAVPAAAPEPVAEAPHRAAPAEAPAAAGRSAARKPVDRPRGRAGGGVRMHNGVPLLD